MQKPEGILKFFDNDLNDYSAFTKPASEVHPKAIRVMDEIEINIRNNKPKTAINF